MCTTVFVGRFRKLVQELYLPSTNFLISVSVCGPLSCKLSVAMLLLKALLFLFSHFGRVHTDKGIHGINEHEYHNYSLQHMSKQINADMEQWRSIPWANLYMDM